jgi:hypothetical protein
LFRAIDPLGNLVTLTRECWCEHICVVHVEMRPLLDKVCQTMADPNYIYTS